MATTEHNARVKTELISANGMNYSRRVVICDACGTVGHFGNESDRMAHAHNATNNVNGVDNSRWEV